MKRLALLVITGFLAVVLSACGEKAEKKAESGAATAVQQGDSTGDAGAAGGAPNDAAKPAQ